MSNPYPKRKKMRLEGWDYRAPGAYFVTVCTAVRHRNILCHITKKYENEGQGHEGRGGTETAPYGVVVRLTEIGRVVDQSIREIPIRNPGVTLDAYCIMPDHIHLMVSWTGRHRDRPLQDMIGRLKSFTDFSYHGGLWQEGLFDHIIRNQHDYLEIMQYIQNNPVAALSKKD